MFRPGSFFKFGVMLAISALAACSNDSDSDSGGVPVPSPTPLPSPTPTPTDVPVVTPTNVETITLTQASRAALANADVTITEAPSAASAQQKQTAEAKANTDASGQLTADLAPGNYNFNVQSGGASFGFLVKIKPGNGNAKVSFITPLSCAQGGICSNVDDDALIASYSGVVFDSDSPVAGAQVQLSAGAATGGAFATDVTGEDGAFTLLVNVNQSLEESLQSARLTVSASGYETLSQAFPVTEEHESGVNLELTELDSETPAGSVLFRETFEADSPTRAAWTVAGGFDAETTWRLHSSGANSMNTLVPAFVTLPPDDSSNGLVPDPDFGQTAYWYGSAELGNFIGEQSDFSAEKDGGTSVRDHAGTLTSPTIDLSGVTPGQALNLSFATWWEIESVNPNCDGFDLMTVEVSTDDGASFVPLARLNPLSDPATGDTDRAPLAFTNLGFNAAAAWLTQEAIPLDELAGEATVRIRFNFETEDGLYNGFRGWMVDEVVIATGEGTFPTFGELACNSPEAASLSKRKRY